MKNRQYTGFLANEMFHDDKIATAREATFHVGYTIMSIHDLNDKTEGADLLLDANLKALIKYKDELENGKRVDVHLAWNLSEDRKHYEDVEVLNVVVTEGE